MVYDSRHPLQILHTSQAAVSSKSNPIALYRELMELPQEKRLFKGVSTHGFADIGKVLYINSFIAPYESDFLNRIKSSNPFYIFTDLLEPQPSVPYRT